MNASVQRTFRWWPVDGGRHAIPGELQPGQAGETLCRHPFIRSRVEPSKLEWIWPTCSVCYERARGYTHVSRAAHHRQAGLPDQRRAEPRQRALATADYLWRWRYEDGWLHAVAPDTTGDGHDVAEAVCGAALDDSTPAAPQGPICPGCFIVVATQAADAQWRL